jgi:hypothetical protein
MYNSICTSGYVVLDALYIFGITFIYISTKYIKFSYVEVEKICN